MRLIQEKTRRSCSHFQMKVLTPLMAPKREGIVSLHQTCFKTEAVETVGNEEQVLGQDGLTRDLLDPTL